MIIDPVFQKRNSWNAIIKSMSRIIFFLPPICKYCTRFWNHPLFLQFFKSIYIYVHRTWLLPFPNLNRSRWRRTAKTLVWSSLRCGFTQTSGPINQVEDKKHNGKYHKTVIINSWAMVFFFLQSCFGFLIGHLPNLHLDNIIIDY